jgi:hypothetical protein
MISTNIATMLEENRSRFNIKNYYVLIFSTV